MRSTWILNFSKSFIFTWNIFTSIKVEFYFFLEIWNLLIICNKMAFFNFILIDRIKILCSTDANKATEKQLSNRYNSPRRLVGGLLYGIKI